MEALGQKVYFGTHSLFENPSVLFIIHTIVSPMRFTRPGALENHRGVLPYFASKSDFNFSYLHRNGDLLFYQSFRKCTTTAKSKENNKRKKNGVVSSLFVVCQELGEPPGTHLTRTVRFEEPIARSLHAELAPN